MQNEVTVSYATDILRITNKKEVVKMSRINPELVQEKPRTHEGAMAKRITKEQELRRSVMSCMLWESDFYEDGVSIATRIQDLARELSLSTVSGIAIEARDKMRLRHAPLWLCVAMAERGGKIVSETITHVIQRSDELAELVALYWVEGKRPLSAQMKKGLAQAFQKFDEYQLAKYDRQGAVRIRDVLFMTHPKPKNDEQAAIWKRLANNELQAPDTWEVGLSKGGDKKETFERLLKENKLGYMALLRNLRNMHQAKVNTKLVFGALQEGAAKSKALPFRFVSAAQAVPAWEPQIESAMLLAAKQLQRLQGKVLLLIDVSGSMAWGLAGKSAMNRMDVACALAVLVREISDCEIFTFSDQLVQVAPRRGFALRDAIVQSQRHGGTYLGKAVSALGQFPHDLMIVFTDEQSHDIVPNPANKGYMINVASNQNGVGYGKWTHIDGWSESVIDYIREVEGAA